MVVICRALVFEFITARLSLKYRSIMKATNWLRIFVSNNGLRKSMTMTVVGGGLGRVLDVASAFYLLVCARIRGNRLRFCIHWRPCVPNIPRIAWCHTYFFCQGVWLVLDSDTHEKGASVAILNLLFVPPHRWVQPKVRINCECWDSRTPFFRQFTRVGDKARP